MMNKTAVKKIQIPEELVKEIGGRITFIRLSYSLKQSDFCRIVGISKGNLSDLENNRYKPSFQAIVKIITHFNVNPHWLLSGTGSPFDDNTEYTPGDDLTGLYRRLKNSVNAKNILEDIAVLEDINGDTLKEVKDYVRFKLKTEIRKNDRRNQERRFTIHPREIPSGKDRRSGIDRRKNFILSWQ
jgi:transcriptional regulator with XRE-family HTH domain